MSDCQCQNESEYSGYSLDDLFWIYKGVVEHMGNNPGTYTLENLRTKLHKELEQHFPGQEKALKKLLHNLPRDLHPKYLRSEVEEYDRDRRFTRKD